MLTVIFFSLIGGFFSLVGGVLLLSSKKSADGLAIYATPFAAGVLLAAAFTDLLPEALIESDNANGILLSTLIGLLGFFMLERFLNWFHHHHEHESAKKSSSSLIIIGDTLHNALDGIAIGAAFLISVPTGIIATVAVAAHEIPQEIGDFGLLLKNGMRRRNVLIVNALSALATTVAAVTVYAVGDSENSFVPFLLAITAGFFIYIATSDIIPEIHDKKSTTKFDWRPWLLLLGVAFVLFASPIAHDYIEAEHSNSDKHEVFDRSCYEEQTAVGETITVCSNI